MIALLAAFQFLTILPPIIRRPFTPEELGRSVAFYPVVGLAVGGALTATALLGFFLPSSIIAGLILAVWVVSTRALHLDGWMDACDGLFGGFTPERRLEIMRDSRVGAFGVAGGALLLIVEYGALQATIAAPIDRIAPLMLAPVLGRWIVALAITLFPYARAEGMGRAMKDHARWPQAVIATLVTVVVAWLAAGVYGLIEMIVALAVGGLAVWFALRRVPGLTGDLYGALCMAVEVVVLVCLAGITP
jgi:adenosylcobinamide-GDP ribazoletransferase